MGRIKIIIISIILNLFISSSASGARVKDIVDIEGVRGNYLIGYGLVLDLKELEMGY